MSDVVLEVNNLHKSFGSLHVLRGLNLTVRRGEAVAVIGPSGKGKSTLLRCINLLEQPDEGQVIFEGTGCATWDSVFSFQVATSFFWRRSWDHSE